MALNIPDSPHPRVVIIGAGFGGLKLARALRKKKMQVVLMDKNNFHQFQPLFYQVAMAGLEPSSITFPLRKVFQKKTEVFIRPVEVKSIDAEAKTVHTEEGDIYYDFLVIATGALTNFYGMKDIEDKAFGLKNISEALYLRNHIFNDLEQSITQESYAERQKYLDVAIVGGGPTGVEIAGALAEMKRHILPKDYHELDEKEVDIYLIQSGDRLLAGMSEKSSKNALQFLKKLGVKVILNDRVTGYDGRWVEMKSGERIEAGKLIWCAGVRATTPLGLKTEAFDQRSGRLNVNKRCQVEGYEDIYAVGDVALMKTDAYPNGHPQVAQVAIQQATFLAKKWTENGCKPNCTFTYKDKGSMATIGRNKAVVDLPWFHLKGFPAWVSWLIVHLFALIGTRNKVVVMINWFWNYLTYDQSLRLIIKPHKRKG